MATTKEQVILDLQVDATEVGKSEAAINNLTQKILLLEKQIKSNKEEMKKSDAELQRNGTSRKQLAITIAKEQVSLQKARTERKQNIKVVKAESTSLNSLMATTNKMVASRNKQNLSTKEGRAEFSRLTKEINKNNIALKKYDAQISRNQRNVGNYPKFTQKVSAGFSAISMGVMGAVGVLMAFGKAMSYTIEFEKQMSKVQALSGATAETMDKLSASAKNYGSTTAFTATEAGQLQEELIKLGFTTDEVLNSTEGILSLAAATGSDLASSAELAGATLRIFNMDASEMSTVTDVLALSTTKSSLSMEKLATIMPTVGKTAQLAGVSLERTVSLAAQLTDRGLDASTAATSLRNIFLELSNKGLTWNQAMQQINASTDKNKTAMDLFGKRAAAAGTILAETGASADELTIALDGAEGSAKKMADTMLDNLAGDVTIANSAWEGFMLSLTDGQGVLSKTSRAAIQSFTGILSGLTDLNNGTTTWLETLDRGGRALITWMSAGIFDMTNTELEKEIELRKQVTGVIEQQTDVLNTNAENQVAYLDDFVNNTINSTNKSFDAVNNGEKAKTELTKDELAERAKAEAELSKETEKELKKRQKAHADYLKNVADGEIRLKELQIEGMESGYDKELAILNLSQEREKASLTKSLENKTQLNAALLLSDSNYLAKKAELYDNYFSIEKEKGVIQIESANAANALELETLAVQNEMKGLLNDEYRESEKEKFNLFDDERFQKSLQIANAGVDLYGAIQDRKLSVLDQSESKELAAAGDNEEKKAEIQKKYAVERYKIERKSFIADKAQKVAMAGIDVAVAITRSLPNVALSALSAALGAVQIATILATPPPAAPTFARGGVMAGVVDVGTSHAGGNDRKMYDQDGNFYGSMERGEMFAIMSRKSTEALALSNFNVQHGGRSFFADSVSRNADGGSLGVQQEAQTPPDLTRIVSAIQQLKLSVNVNDINTAQDTKVRVINNASY